MAHTSPSRQRLLSLVLLAVLFGSVLVAWAIVRSKQAPIVRAEAILHQIRQRSLESYWKDRVETACYLTRDAAGQPIGFAVQARWRDGDRYVGAALLQADGHQQAEKWTIDPSATAGEYLGDAGLAALRETRISLSNGQVTVQQPRTRPATKTTPGNYIPEGLTWLVLAEVSKANKPAVFCSVFNSEAIVPGLNEVNFTAVTMTPLGNGKVRLRAQLAEGRVDMTYQVDAKGKVVLIEDNLSNGVSTLTDAPNLVKVFPEATELLPLLASPPDETTQPHPPVASPQSVEL